MSDYNISKSRAIEIIPAQPGWRVKAWKDGGDREWVLPVAAWARIESWNEDEEGYVENGSERITVEPLFTLDGGPGLIWSSRLTEVSSDFAVIVLSPAESGVE